jgi:hypothetical protein
VPLGTANTRARIAHLLYNTQCCNFYHILYYSTHNDPRTFSVWIKWHYIKCEDDSGFKKQEVPRSKRAKDKVMVLLSCNADGNRKLHSLIVEEHEEPHSLESLRHYQHDYKPCKESHDTGILIREG